MRNVRSYGKQKKAKFAMAFHAFQPVFNFEEELEKAFQLAYGPFLGVMKKFPGIKGTFHFSGNVLEWLSKQHPEYIETLRDMLGSGQIEIMGGGFFEPVMSVIPRNDAVEQLRMMNAKLDEIFALKPEGVWTTERVWHRNLVDIFRQEGIKYTILDDNHLLSTYSGDRGKFSPCVTSGDTEDITICPSSAQLRYLIPFRPVREILRYMKDVMSRSEGVAPCFFFADDLEKFGLWPRTHAHVYSKKWLEKFFKALERESEWLETATYAELAGIEGKPDLGVLPPGSYGEMDGWSGGDFTNFMKKYPESGRMYERMLDVSGRVSDMVSRADHPDSAARFENAKEELFKAQTSCPYWHGTFGGVYLPHLRSGVYTHIIRAEKMLRAVPEGPESDVYRGERKTGDGGAEEVLGNSHLKLYVNPCRGACIEEIDLMAREINPLTAFSRREEKYHRKLETGYGSVIRKARRKALRGDLGDIDIHELLGVGERGLKKLLSYDGYRRVGFITRVIPGRVKWESLVDVDKSPGGFMDGNYRMDPVSCDGSVTRVYTRRETIQANAGRSIDMEITKKVTLGFTRDFNISQSARSFSEHAEGISICAEFNFLVWDTEAMKGPKTYTAASVQFEDRYSGLTIEIVSDTPLQITTYPVYTVNETERGLGKTFQGICVVMGDSYALSEGHEQIEQAITVRMR